MTETIAPTSKPRASTLIVFGAIAAVVIGLLVLLAIAVSTRGAPPLAAGTAPDFSLTTFDGKTYKLSELKGKPVVINFWASWCIPCRDEAPAFQRAWESYNERGLIILGVDYVDTETDAKKFIAEFNQTYPNGPDLGTRISQLFRISGVPETYFVGKDGRLLQGIDAQGRVKGNWIGPVPEEVLLARVQEMLSQ